MPGQLPRPKNIDAQVTYVRQHLFARIKKNKASIFTELSEDKALVHFRAMVDLERGLGLNLGDNPVDKLRDYITSNTEMANAIDDIGTDGDLSGLQEEGDQGDESDAAGGVPGG